MSQRGTKQIEIEQKKKNSIMYMYITALVVCGNWVQCTALNFRFLTSHFQAYILYFLSKYTLKRAQLFVSFFLTNRILRKGLAVV